MNEDARLAINTRFGTEVGVAESIAIEYENVNFDREGKAEWVRVSISDGNAFNASMGTTKKIRTPGVVQATIFVKRGSGTKRVRELADVISDAFRNLVLTQGTTVLTFNVPTMGNGDAGDPVLYWENIFLPFFGESTKVDAS